MILCGWIYILVDKIQHFASFVLNLLLMVIAKESITELFYSYERRNDVSQGMMVILGIKTLCTHFSYTNDNDSAVDTCLSNIVTIKRVPLYKPNDLSIFIISIRVKYHSCQWPILKISVWPTDNKKSYSDQWTKQIVHFGQLTTEKYNTLIFTCDCMWHS